MLASCVFPAHIPPKLVQAHKFAFLAFWPVHTRLHRWVFTRLRPKSLRPIAHFMLCRSVHCSQSGEERNEKEMRQWRRTVRYDV